MAGKQQCQERDRAERQDYLPPISLDSSQSTDTDRWGDDRLREECGVFGIFGHDDAAAVPRWVCTPSSIAARKAVASSPATILVHFNQERRLGLVGDNFNKADVIRRLQGRSAIGHNRYSTTGDVTLRNVQPLFADLNSAASPSPTTAT